MVSKGDKTIAKAQVLSQAFITLGSIITAFGTLIFVTLVVEGTKIFSEILEITGIVPFGYGIGTMAIGISLILLGIFLPWKMIDSAE